MVLKWGEGGARGVCQVWDGEVKAVNEGSGESPSLDRLDIHHLAAANGTLLRTRVKLPPRGTVVLIDTEGGWSNTPSSHPVNLRGFHAAGPPVCAPKSYSVDTPTPTPTPTHSGIAGQRGE